MNFSTNRPYKGRAPLLSNLPNIQNIPNTPNTQKIQQNTITIQSGRFSMFLPPPSECNSCGNAK